VRVRVRVRARCGVARLLLGEVAQVGMELLRLGLEAWHACLGVGLGVGLG